MCHTLRKIGMNFPGRASLTLWLVMLAAAPAVSAHGLDVTGRWAADVATADGTGAVYLTIVNDAYHPEYLYNVSTPVAARVEVHRTLTKGEMVRVDRLEIPFSDSIDMRKAGYHLMLIGLKRPLNRGDEISLELTFSDARVQKTQVTVPDNR
jgi:copper(I)-binding protein